MMLCRALSERLFPRANYSAKLLGFVDLLLSRTGAECNTGGDQWQVAEGGGILVFVRIIFVPDYGQAS